VLIGCVFGATGFLFVFEPYINTDRDPQIKGPNLANIKPQDMLSRDQFETLRKLRIRDALDEYKKNHWRS
jgi:hypothetical protein